MKFNFPTIKSLMALLLATGFAMSANAQSDLIIVNNTSGNLEKNILADESIFDDLSNVNFLKITGDVNGRDMNVFTKLVNLQYLDLSDANVVADENGDKVIRGCESLYYLQKVVLPTDINAIESRAFQNCQNLQSINLENVTKIGNTAFSQCYSLDNVDISNVSRVEYDTFAYARNLKNLIVSEKLEYLESNSFVGTGLESFVVPKNCQLGYYPFQGSQLKSLVYYDNTKIGSESLLYLQQLKDVYCLDPIPYSKGDRIKLSNHDVNLHVPAFALKNYDESSRFLDFNNVVALEWDLDYMSVNNGILSIDTTEGLAYGFDFNLGVDGTFVNNSAEDLKINNFVQNAFYGPSSNYEQDPNNTRILSSSSFLSKSKTEAQNVAVNLGLVNSRHWSGSNCWNFISFPFNVNISEIVPPDDALWTIREYDGYNRGLNPYDGTSKWINKNTGTLEAGKGYIIHFSAENIEENRYGNGYDYALNYFKFPAVDDAKKNNIFQNEDAVVKLNYYYSDWDHNKSWNLVGNPYDCYYDVNCIEYSNASGVSRVPITVWRRINNSYTYEAFSADDDFDLLPFEAFFVQGIDENNLEMVFKKEGRKYSSLSTRAASDIIDPLKGTARSIFNLHISGENGKDRTRLVVNPAASVNYEISCDASKFLSPDVDNCQIYMMESNEMLAINERPFGEGVYKMGVRIGKAGDYTISCDTRNAADYDVILIDTFTGKEVSLLKEGYTFNADKGSDTRFMLKLKTSGSTDGNGDSTGIEQVGIAPEISINGHSLTVNAQGEINVYSIDGNVVAAGTDCLQTILPQGLYIIKTAQNSVKAMIR